MLGILSKPSVRYGPGIFGLPSTIRTCDLRLRRALLYPAELWADGNTNCWTKESWSGRKDSNLRPSAPKADALPGCATPRQGSYFTWAKQFHLKVATRSFNLATLRQFLICFRSNLLVCKFCKTLTI